MTQQLQEVYSEMEFEELSCRKKLLNATLISLKLNT